MSELDSYQDLLKYAKYRVRCTADAEDLVQQVYLHWYSRPFDAQDKGSFLMFLLKQYISKYYRHKKVISNICSLEEVTTLDDQGEVREVYSLGTAYNDGEYRLDSKYFINILKYKDPDEVKAHYNLLNKPYNKLTCKSEIKREKRKDGRIGEYHSFTACCRSRALKKVKQV